MPCRCSTALADCGFRCHFIRRKGISVSPPLHYRIVPELDGGIGARCFRHRHLPRYAKLQPARFLRCAMSLPARGRREESCIWAERSASGSLKGMVTEFPGIAVNTPMHFKGNRRLPSSLTIGWRPSRHRRRRAFACASGTMAGTYAQSSCDTLAPPEEGWHDTGISGVS
jgi:hypothetical protein